MTLAGHAFTVAVFTVAAPFAALAQTQATVAPDAPTASPLSPTALQHAEELQSDAPLAIWVRHGPGTETCPSSVELITRVRSRLPSDATAHAVRRPLRNVFVYFAREGAGYRAALEQRSEDGHQGGSRVLSDPSQDCTQISDAVVLTLTLLAEGADSLKPTPETVPPSAAASSSGDTSPATATPPLDTRTSPPKRSSARDSTESSRPTDSHSDDSSASTRWAELSVGPWIGWRVLPGAAVGVRLGQVLGISRWLGIGAGADYATSDEASSNGDRYRFSLTSGWLGPAVRQPMGSRWQATGELALLVGMTHAAVITARPVRPGDFPFYGARAGAALGFWISEPFVVSLGAHGRVPFGRGVFRAAGQAQPIWRQPFVGLSTELAIGCASW